MAQTELWGLILVQAAGQAARVKMKEGERASFRLWQKRGSVRSFSRGTKVWGDLGDRGACAMERGSLSLTALWLVLELGQQQHTENANQMQM